MVATDVLGGEAGLLGGGVAGDEDLDDGLLDGEEDEPDRELEEPGFELDELVESDELDELDELEELDDELVPAAVGAAPESPPGEVPVGLPGVGVNTSEVEPGGVA